jgi:anti-sigma-K factor RskA
MNSTLQPIPPRLIDLMVEQATQGLSPQDEAELQAAIASDEAIRAEAEAYALAATAVELTLTKPTQVEVLPEALRSKLIATASDIVHTAKPELKLRGTAAAQPAKKEAFSFTDGRMFGWYAAIAALVALALVLVGPNTPTTTTPGPGDGVVEVQPTYDELLAEAETVTASWGFNADGGDERFANATGEVIWNADEQAGYMKLAGLPVNDPTKEQYQLWIVDPARDAEPIDGGVFDITAQGEIIVPIDAKLRSDTPAVFAITIEQPGGVVVSEGPLQVVAAVEQKS